MTTARPHYSHDHFTTDSVLVWFPYLLEAGDGVHEFDVQLGVVLSQRLVSVVVDELHHRAERQRVREAVLPVPMVDLYQLVVSPFPGRKGCVCKNMSTRP